MHRHQVPGFDVFDWSSTFSHTFDIFANSLTITRDDFANFLHSDRDEIGVAYGWWWVAGFDERKREYVLDDARFKQSDVQDGAFLFGEYSVGVDFKQ